MIDLRNIPRIINGILALGGGLGGLTICMRDDPCVTPFAIFFTVSSVIGWAAFFGKTDADTHANIGPAPSPTKKTPQHCTPESKP